MRVTYNTWDWFLLFVNISNYHEWADMALRLGNSFLRNDFRQIRIKFKWKHQSNQYYYAKETNKSIYCCQFAWINIANDIKLNKLIHWLIDGLRTLTHDIYATDNLREKTIIWEKYSQMSWRIGMKVLKRSFVEKSSLLVSLNSEKM